jgi:hypothetical protein
MEARNNDYLIPPSIEADFEMFCVPQIENFILWLKLHEIADLV